MTLGKVLSNKSDPSCKKGTLSYKAEDGVCVREVETGHFPLKQEASGAHRALGAPMAAMDDSSPASADSACFSALTSTILSPVFLFFCSE